MANEKLKMANKGNKLAIFNLINFYIFFITSQGTFINYLNLNSLNNFQVLSSHLKIETLSKLHLKSHSYLLTYSHNSS